MPLQSNCFLQGHFLYVSIMRFKTIFWLIPEMITVLLIVAVFIGMWLEEDFSWKFILLLAGLIGVSINTYKNIKELLAEDKEYDPEI